MFAGSALQSLYETAGLVAIASALFSIVALGALAICRADGSAPPPRLWIGLAITCPAVFIASIVAVGAFSSTLT